MALIEHMKAEGFLHSAHLVRPLLVDDPADIVATILEAAVPAERPEGDDSIIRHL
jgi:hypothetical protein